MIRLENDTRYLNNGREYTEQVNDIIPESELRITVVEDGYVLPKSDKYLCKGGVAYKDKKFVEESSIQNEGSFIRINGGYDFDEYSEKYYETPVIYLGYFFRHWGHFLMDCTTRMWILLDEKYDSYKVVFPNHPANVRDGNYNRFLQLLGIDEDRIIPVDIPSRFKTIIVPSEGRIQTLYTHTDRWYDLFDRVSDNAEYDPKKVPERVYFSRGKMGKPELGEDEIEHNYRINGYEIIFPELLTLDEQIGIFRCANEVVSSNSSICMNVVFARPGLKWTVINKYSAVHDNFTELRYKKELDITYVDAYSDKLNFYGEIIGSMPYLVGFNDNMKRLFDDMGMSYETFGRWKRIGNVLRYYWKCLIQNPKVWYRINAARLVRFMKRNTPWLYRLLKGIMVKLHL